MTLGDIPAFSELHSQLIATFASVLVIVALFAYLDFKGGSIGKRAAGLEVYFTQRSFSRSLVRNTAEQLKICRQAMRAALPVSEWSNLFA